MEIISIEDIQRATSLYEVKNEIAKQPSKEILKFFEEIESMEGVNELKSFLP
jgi:hypothetical protein